MSPLKRSSHLLCPPFARAFSDGADALPAPGTALATAWAAQPPARPGLSSGPLSAGAEVRPRPGKRVLIVEDDELTREMLLTILGAEGYRAAAVANGREALNYLCAAPAPDLILLDLLMPVMNGYEFIQRQAEDPCLAGIPVVVISATGPELAEAGLPQHVPFLRKPITVEELLAVMQTC